MQHALIHQILQDKKKHCKPKRMLLEKSEAELLEKSEVELLEKREIELLEKREVELLEEKRKRVRFAPFELSKSFCDYHCL